MAIHCSNCGDGGTAGHGKLGALGKAGGWGCWWYELSRRNQEGGNGGDGGASGSGGRGGGGQGGPSIGISVYPSTALTCSGNLITQGSAGAFGIGANNGASGMSEVCFDFQTSGACVCP